MLNPSYMHSFSMTEHYFILLEQPLTVSVTGVMSAVLKGDSLSSALRWDEKRDVKFHLINRQTGKRFHIKYVSRAFFFLHTINAYEDRDHVVLDVCGYDSPAMMDCMFVEQLQTAQFNPNYAPLFRGECEWVCATQCLDSLALRELVLIKSKLVRHYLKVSIDGT